MENAIVQACLGSQKWNSLAIILFWVFFSSFIFREFAIEGQNNLRYNGKKPAIMEPQQISQQNLLLFSVFSLSPTFQDCTTTQAEWSLYDSWMYSLPFHIHFLPCHPVPRLESSCNLNTKKLKPLLYRIQHPLPPTHRIKMKISVR